MADKRIEEEVARQLAAQMDARFIVDQLRQADDAVKEELANDIARALSDMQRADLVTFGKDAFNTRYLVNDVEVTRDYYGTEVGLTGGKGQFDIYNLQGPGVEAHIDSASNARQLNVRVRTGGGADCMFTRLVSECWADEVAAGRGVEGQAMTSLTGCTFNVYSTPFGASGAITAMNTAAAAAAALGEAADEVLFICGGSYTVSATQAVTPNTYSSFRFVGSHQQATTFVADTNSIVVLNIGGIQQGAVVTIEEICFDLDVLGADLVTAIDFGSSTQATIHNCTFTVGALNVGIKPGPSGAECRIYDNIFDGGGAAIGTELGINMTVMGNTFSSMDRGVAMTNDAQFTITDNIFDACTTGIEFSGNSSATDCIIANNRFNSCTKGINALTGTNIQYNTAIVANNFVIGSGEVGIDFSEMNGSGLITTWQIGPNTFRATHSTALGIRGDAVFTVNQITNNTFRNFTSGNEISGLAATTVAAHNVSDAGAIADNGAPYGHAAGTATAAPSPHNLVSAHHDGEQDYTNALYLGELRLGINGTTGDLTWYTDAGTTQIAQVDGATGDAVFGSNGTGAFVINGAAATPHQVTAQTGGTRAQIAMARHSNITGIGPAYNFFRSRGSVASQTALTTSGSLLGTLQWHGHDGTDYKLAANFRAEIEGTPGAGDMPGALIWGTTPDGSASATDRMRLQAAGGLLLAQYAYVGSATASTSPTNVTAGDLTATRLIVPNATILHSAITQLGGPVVIPTQGALRFSDTDNSHYTGFKAHGTTTASVEYTWPPADGSSGQQLTTDGAGVLSWAAAGSGGGGGSPHALLDGGTAHTDTAVDTVSRGSLIYGNSTPAWDELVIGTSGHVLRSDGTDAAWAKLDSDDVDYVPASTADWGGSDPGDVEQALDVLADRTSKQMIYIPGWQLIPSYDRAAWVTAPSVHTVTTNDFAYRALQFDGSAKQYSAGDFPLPPNYDASTLTARFRWKSTGGSGTIIWGIQMLSVADDDAHDAAMGTAIEVTDTITTVGDYQRSDATGAITPSGTAAAADHIFFEVYRDGANDTNTSVCQLIGIEIYFGLTAAGVA